MTFNISLAAISDAEEILAVQRQAYLIEAERYQDHSIIPLRQTLQELQQQFNDHIFLKAVSDNRITGTVRAYEKDGTCHIGRLAVLPEMQKQGIGTALMQEIERHYRPARYELFVGTKSENNIHLYSKLGYRICRQEKYECGDIEIYIMEKEGVR